jgi:hypothetical protein
MSVVKFEDMTAEQERKAARQEELVEKIRGLFDDEAAAEDEALGALVQLVAWIVAREPSDARAALLKNVVEGLQTAVRLSVGH